MYQVVVAICLILMIVVLYNCGPWDYQEQAYLAAPSFSDSLVDSYRGSIKDSRGMTFNDYAVESHIVNSTPLSGEYRIL